MYKNTEYSRWKTQHLAGFTAILAVTTKLQLIKIVHKIVHNYVGTPSRECQKTKGKPYFSMTSSNAGISSPLMLSIELLARRIEVVRRRILRFFGWVWPVDTYLYLQCPYYAEWALLSPIKKLTTRIEWTFLAL